MFDKLNQTRQQLEQEGHYGAAKKDETEKIATIETLVFDDDYLLNSDHSSDEEEETMIHAAKLYLDKDAQDNIHTAIKEAKNVEIVESTDCWNQEFFRPGSKVKLSHICTRSFCSFLF